MADEKYNPYGTRTICIDGAIEMETFEKVNYELTKFALESKEPILVYIDSQGGSVEAALLIADLFLLSPCKIEGRVVGRCHSVALIVLSVCDIKRASPNSTFCIHHTRGSFEYVVNKDFAQALKIFEKQVRDAQERVNSFLALQNCISEKKIDELMTAGDLGQILAANQMKELGFLHSSCHFGAL